MRALVLLASFGGTLAQSSVVPALAVGGVAPDLLLILTVAVALRRGPESGCLMGFLAGLLQDAAGGGLLGVQALTKALLGFGTGLLVGRLWLTTPLVQVPGLAVLSVVEGVARFLLLQLFHFPAGAGELLLHVILPQALYNGLVGAAWLLVVSVGEALRRHGSWT